MYITSMELGIPEELLIRLTDDEGSGMANLARADEAITEASGYVDAALLPRFSVPVSDPSELVRSITRDIAVYNLYKRTGVVTEDVKSARDSAVEMLAKAATGTFHLGLAPGMPGPEFGCSAREFTRGHMEGY